MATDLGELQRKLWEAADQLRANSGLRASEYSTPVLGLIFLRYADLRFGAAHAELEGKGSGRRKIGAADYHARGVLHLPDEAGFDRLLNLPEGANLGKAINEAMAAIENTNPDLDGVGHAPSVSSRRTCRTYR
jgi:type I restriction enzyme M protein